MNGGRAAIVRCVAAQQINVITCLHVHLLLIVYRLLLLLLLLLAQVRAARHVARPLFPFLFAVVEKATTNVKVEEVVWLIVSAYNLVTLNCM